MCSFSAGNVVFQAPALPGIAPRKHLEASPLSTSLGATFLVHINGLISEYMRLQARNCFLEKENRLLVQAQEPERLEEASSSRRVSRSVASSPQRGPSEQALSRASTELAQLLRAAQSVVQEIPFFGSSDDSETESAPAFGSVLLGAPARRQPAFDPPLDQLGRSQSWSPGGRIAESNRVHRRESLSPAGRIAESNRTAREHSRDALLQAFEGTGPKKSRRGSPRHDSIRSSESSIYPQRRDGKKSWHFIRPLGSADRRSIDEVCWNKKSFVQRAKASTIGYLG